MLGSLRFLDKSVCVRLNARRKVTGTLRGYDQFMNLVLEGLIVVLIDILSASEYIYIYIYIGLSIVSDFFLSVALLQILWRRFPRPRSTISG